MYILYQGGASQELSQGVIGQVMEIGADLANLLLNLGREKQRLQEELAYSINAVFVENKKILKKQLGLEELK